MSDPSEVEARGPLRVTRRLTIPSGEIALSFSRSSGPGGQNVNKLETRVTLRFATRTSRALSDEDRAWLSERLAGRLTRDGELVVHASTFRERERNLVAARERLAQILRSALARPKQRRATRPTHASATRRLEHKRRRGRDKALRRRSDGD